MAYLTVWFVFLLTAAGAEPQGYIPPQEVHKIDMSCGLPGAVVGVQIDRLVNPSTMLFPDPGFAGLHCTASIAARIATLAPGDYELATTEMGDGSTTPYIGIDPHVSVRWRRVIDTSGITSPSKPGAIRVGPPPQ